MDNNDLINCKTCLNRNFDFKTGLSCKLTGGKPDFNTNCPNYSKDESAIARTESEKEYSHVESETGLGRFWLFIAWIVLPLSIITSWIQLFSNQINVLSIIISIWYTIFSIYTLISFISHKSNGKIYFALILLFGIINNIIITISGTDFSLLSALIGVIVLVGLFASPSLKDYFPMKKVAICWYDWTFFLIPMIIILLIGFIGAIALHYQ